MQIRAYKDLQSLHTFGVPWQCQVYCSLHTAEEAKKAIEYANEQGIEVFILGGGSNILPVDDWPGLVIRNEIGGRAITAVDSDTTHLEIGSGENWHALVLWSLEQGLFGLENLALIPGTVGGAVVQNIGAYDVDIARYVEAVEVIEIATAKRYWLQGKDCEFAYRDSIFKRPQGKWMITAVRLVLHNAFTPVLSYKALQDALAGVLCPRAQDVAQAVMDIRRSKLPDWEQTGTAGSFFGNPRVGDGELARLQAEYPDIPVFHNYNLSEHTIPAGWLVENCGLPAEDKEKYLSAKHHLVVVNNNKNTDITSGAEIYQFTRRIQQQVHEQFDITLVPEVVVL
jgi:UDP-N-acetylmuramate dehydrogenase